MSDNGPQFTSDAFQKFVDAYEFRHCTSSPDYPQSNGKSENAVKTAKRIMEKAFAVGADPYLGFLDFRNTPTEGLATSPVQRLFGRRTKTVLPMSSKLLMSERNSGTVQRLSDRKRKQMLYYNRTAKSLKPLKKGDTVFVRPAKRGREWRRAIVNKAMGISSYVVTTNHGSNIRRNRRHLRLASGTELPASPSKPTTEVTRVVEPPKSPVRYSTTEGNQNTAESNQQDVVDRRSAVDQSLDNAGESQPINVQSPIRYNSRGRVLRKPSYLKDYDC